MTFQKEFAQMTIYGHSIEKIACVDGSALDGDFLNLDFLLEKFPQTEFHLQAIECQKRVLRFGLYGRDIPHQQVERKAQIQASYGDVQARGFGSDCRSLVHRKTLDWRQIEQQYQQREEHER